MILEHFPLLQTFAMHISRQASAKAISFEYQESLYLNYLIRCTSSLTGYPIEYVPELDIVYYGQIHFPKQGTQEGGPIILATSDICQEHEIELTVGHEIGHILIVYYNSLHLQDNEFKKMTLMEQWRFLSNKIVLVDRATSKKFPDEWFAGFEKSIRSTSQPIDNIKLLLENRGSGEITEKDIQELLCEEIGLFLIEERKRNQLLFFLKRSERQLALF